MARRSRLRTEKRLATLEAVAESFRPGPPPREWTVDELAEIMSALRRAMGEEEFEHFVGVDLARLLRKHR